MSQGSLQIFTGDLPEASELNSAHKIGDGVCKKGNVTSHVQLVVQRVTLYVDNLLTL